MSGWPEHRHDQAFYGSTRQYRLPWIGDTEMNIKLCVYSNLPLLVQLLVELKGVG